VTVQGIDSASRTSEGALTFGHIYNAYFPFVWRNARRLGIPASLLEDVTQEVFVVVYRKLGEFEERSTLKTWIFSITHFVVRKHRRSLSRHPSVGSTAHDVPPDPNGVQQSHAAPDEVLAKRQAGQFLHDFLESIDDAKRDVFVLAELEQMTAPEIANSLRLNVNTVYSRLRLAREAFACAVARRRAHDAGRAP
jgi:RNA polymerase sigma-70 factor (ECF subfamily)